MEFSGNTTRIPLLSKDNYDTWKIRIQAVMVKNKTWPYVTGRNVKPEPTANNAEAVTAWNDEDEKAKADLYLAINDVELKQVKNCVTARDIWLKLESIFESKGPAKKASLWRRLITHRLKVSGNVHVHIDEFFDIVNELSELNIEIGDELQSIMLLHSLPENFDNFRCAIESRDNLPDPEALKIKILDEDTSRTERTQNNEHADALFARRTRQKTKKKKPEKKETTSTDGTFKYKCHYCRKVGHKAAECPDKKENAKAAEDESFLALQSMNISYRTDCDERETRWCLDSGCTSHLCNDGGRFTQSSDIKHATLNLANHTSAEVKGRGTVRIETTNGETVKGIQLKDTLHVPDLRSNLMSVAKIVDAEYTVTFDKNRAEIRKKKDRDILLIADRIGDLYYVRESPEQLACVSSTNIKKSQLQIWHERLGHLNESDLLEMHKREAVLGMKIRKGEKLPPCEVCSSGKLTALSFPKSSQKNTDILDIIHTDVCGPMRTESRGKAKYFITFTDDCSRWTAVYFLQNKSDVLRIFKEFKKYVEKQTGRKLKCLRSDNGKEFCNRAFDDYLKEEGIGRRLTTPHTPQQNGVTERKNRTLVEMARCMLTQSGLPRSFWAEAIMTANYVRNRCITNVLHGKTPFEIWTKKRPNIENLRIFGELAYVLDKNPSKGKFDPRGIKCLFVGYDTSAKGYRVWVPSEQKIKISRDVKFFGITEPKGTCDEDEVEDKETEARSPLDLVTFNFNPGVEEPVVGNETEGPVDEKEVEEPVVEAETEETSERHNPLNTKRGPGRPAKVLTGQRGRPKKRYNTVESRDSQENTPESNDESDNESTEDSANIA